MNPVSKYHPLAHYKWGNDCDSWNLVDESTLSVKQERIPPGSAEVMHFHDQSQQFFFILRGIATIVTDSSTVTVKPGEGLYIRPRCQHKILNDSTEVVEFLLCAQPSTKTDRINCG